MPRNNKKRKNNSSGGGGGNNTQRRKGKPIRFSKSEIESERKAEEAKSGGDEATTELRQDNPICADEAAAATSKILSFEHSFAVDKAEGISISDDADGNGGASDSAGESEDEIENRVSVERRAASSGSEQNDKNSENLEISTATAAAAAATAPSARDEASCCILSTAHAAHSSQLASESDAANTNEPSDESERGDECVEQSASLEERTSSDFRQPIDSEAAENNENSIERANEIQGNLKIDAESGDNSESKTAIGSDEICGAANLEVAQEPPIDAETIEQSNEMRSEPAAAEPPTGESIARRRTPPPLVSPFASPSVLNVIREENSDATDVERKTEEECWQSADRAKAKKADAVFPRSHFDFSSLGRHSSLVSPKASAIREEPPLFLVDTKIVEVEAVAESSKKWTVASTQQPHQAELVFLDSTSGSSQASLSDTEAHDEESEVRIETPTIGSAAGSAFSAVQKPESPPPDEDLSGLRRFLNLPKADASATPSAPRQAPAPPARRFAPAAKPIDKLGQLFKSIEVTRSLGVETTFKPINESTESLLIQLRNVIASPGSSACDSDNDSRADNDHPITQTQTLGKPHETMQPVPRPDFRIGAPCSTNMFGSLPAITNLSKHILSDLKTSDVHRQDSSSSHCSSSHSQCTVLCLTGRSSRDDLDLLNYVASHECFSGSSSLHTLDGGPPFRSLRQLCIERLTSMPHGLAILEELAKVAESFAHLTDKHKTPRSNRPSVDEEMPYPRPDLPRIDDLELDVGPQPQQPPPPPRQRRTVVKLVPSLESRSPVPPPVPERPWLGVPTQEDPHVLVCFSPAQRQLLKENGSGERNGANVADQLLDMHNKFVDRRGYHELTDDEVRAINFRKSSLSSSAEYEVPVSGTSSADSKDSRLLALIRDINQLSNAASRSEAPSASAKSTSAMTNASNGENSDRNRSSASDQSQSDRSSDKMSRLSFSSPHGGDSFNSKRYSTYYDELSRLNPIAEEPQAKKRFSTIETSSRESQKRIENGEVVYEFAESSAQKSNDGDAADRKESDSSEVKSKLTPSADVNSEYRRFAESKNSPASESAAERNESAQSNENGAASDKRSFFKEFDYIPKFFTDMFGRADKPSPSAHSEQGSTSERVSESSSSRKEHTVIIEKAEEGSAKLAPPASAPIPLSKGSNQYLSTHSLFDWGERRGSTPDRCSSSLSVSRDDYSRGRRRSISPSVPIRAPRIKDEPTPVASSAPKADTAQRRYEAYPTSHNRNYEQRQSMIDQTPITRHVSHDWKRMSMPKIDHEKKLQYYLDKEKSLGQEYDKLEHDRLRLMIELEEMRVNQSFEDFVRQHKTRNGSEQSPGSLSEQELFRKRMQDEWLNKVAEREERRMQKIIKISNASEVTETSRSSTGRGLGDEFMERVRERRDKLQMPADSDWESGAESQPVRRDHPSPQIDPNVKVIEGEQEADLKNLPEHLKEFAEFVAKKQQEEAERLAKVATTKASTTEKSTETHKEIIHRIVREGDEREASDGESRLVNAVISFVTFVRSFVFLFCF